MVMAVLGAATRLTTMLVEMMPGVTMEATFATTVTAASACVSPGPIARDSTWTQGTPLGGLIDE